MSFPGGGGDDVQTFEPPEFLQPFIDEALTGAQNLFQNFTPQPFPGSTVAGQSPFTQQGVDQLSQFGDSSFNVGAIGGAQEAQSNLLGFNPTLAAGLANAPQAVNFFGNALTQGDPSAALNQALNVQPGSNPFVQQLITDVQGLNTRNFQQSILPQIRNDAEIQGGFGGSRQGIAEGLALQALIDANARAGTQISNDQFNQDMARQLQAIGLGNQLSLGAGQLSTGLLEGGFGQGLTGSTAALAFAPQLQQLGLTGTGALLQAGGIEEQFRQRLIDDEVQRFDFTQQQPFINQNQFTNTIAGLGSGFGTRTNEGSSGGIAGALGGASTALGLYGELGAMFPVIAANPWVGGTMAVLGALGGLF